MVMVATNSHATKLLADCNTVMDMDVYVQLQFTVLYWYCTVLCIRRRFALKYARKPAFYLHVRANEIAPPRAKRARTMSHATPSRHRPIATNDARRNQNQKRRGGASTVNGDTIISYIFGGLICL
jgi:hypothetical protein